MHWDLINTRSEWKGSSPSTRVPQGKIRDPTLSPFLEGASSRLRVAAAAEKPGCCCPDSLFSDAASGFFATLLPSTPCPPDTPKLLLICRVGVPASAVPAAAPRFLLQPTSPSSPPGITAAALAPQRPLQPLGSALPGQELPAPLPAVTGTAPKGKASDS